MANKTTFWTQNVPQLSPETIADMRDWVAECFDCSLDAQYGGEFEDVEMSDRDVIRYVAKHYDGGLNGFLASM